MALGVTQASKPLNTNLSPVLTGFRRRVGDTFSVELLLELHIDDTVAVDDPEDDSVAEEARQHDEPGSRASVRSSHLHLLHGLRAAARCRLRHCGAPAARTEEGRPLPAVLTTHATATESPRPYTWIVVSTHQCPVLLGCSLQARDTSSI